MVEGICREFKIIHKITHKQLLGLFNLFSFYFFIKPLRLMFFHARLKQVVLSTAACILLFISEVQTEPGVVVCKFVILLIALIYRLKPSKKNRFTAWIYCVFISCHPTKNCSRKHGFKTDCCGILGGFFATSRHQKGDSSCRTFKITTF